jgi:hypothetical protein
VTTQCEGFSRTLLDESLHHCPYEATERVQGVDCCYFHGKVLRGEITDVLVGHALKPLSWNPRGKPKHRGAGPAEAVPMTDPLIHLLRQDWT